MAQMALRTKIEHAREYWRALILGEGLLWTTGAVVFLFTLGFYVDRTSPLSVEARLGYWTLLGVAFLALLIALALRPYLSRHSAETVATRVERRYPHLRERLLSAVEFSSSSVEGFSPALLEDIQKDAQSVAGGLDFRAAFARDGLRRSATAFAMVAGFVVLHLLFAGPAFGRYVERMGLSNKPVFRDTEVQVSPLRTKTLKGSEFTITVDQSKKPVSEATLNYRIGQGHWNRVVLRGDAGADFTFRIAGLTDDIRYYAVAGDGRSDEGIADAVDPAAIIGARMRLEYPAYMDRPAATVNVESGGIAAPVGTRVSLELKANKPLSAAEATVPPRGTMAWSVDGDLVRGELTVGQPGSYSVQLRDADGFQAPSPQTFPIKAIVDQSPEVQLHEPTGDMDVTPNAAVRLKISARDDYGVGAVRLPYTMAGRAAKSIPVGVGERNRKTLELESIWEITQLRVRPGDTIRYRVEAQDWDNLNGPHLGKTPDLALHIIDEAEARRRYEESRAEILLQLRELIQEQKGTRADVDRQRATDKMKPEAIRAAEDRQRGAASTSQDLARRVAELGRMGETNRLADARETEQQRQAAAGLQRQGQQAMPQAANRVGSAQSQAQADPKGARAELGQASQEQQKIEEDLRKIQEQLQATNELQRLAQRFDQLAQQQRGLQRKTEQALPQTLGRPAGELNPQERQRLQELARAQQSVQKATTQAMSDLQRAAKNLEGSKPEQAQAAQETAQELQQGQVTEQQSQASQNTQQNSLGQARTQQENAAKQLERAAQQLRDAQNQDQRSLQQQLQSAMNRLNQAMQQQQGLSRQSQQSMSQQQQRAAAAEQRRLEEQVRQLARQLQRLERRSPDAGEAAKQLNQAGDQQNQASQELNKGQQGEAQKKQQQAMESMQRAMQSLQQAMQQAKAEADPFAELRNRLTKLASRQKSVRDATRRIDESQRQKGPDSDDNAALQRLARQQQEIEGETQKVEADLPGDLLKQFAGQARQSMQRSQQALTQNNPKDNPTGRSQARAQTILEQLSRALGDDDDPTKDEAGGGGGGGGGGGKPDMELLKRLAEVRLLRFTEMAIRARTEELDNRRREGETLTEEQKTELDEATRQQRQAKQQADQIAQALQRYRTLAQKVTKAGAHMKEAQRGLERENTGDAVQEQISQAIVGLNEALTRIRQQQQQQQRQQQQQQQQQQAGRQPGSQQGSAPSPGMAQSGSSPAMRSLQRRTGLSTGAQGGFDEDARGFAGLDGRSTDALRQSYKEKKPAEYEDLINRYYRALSERGR